MTIKNKTKILFVDDDPDIRELISDYLGGHGFEVATADGAPATVFYRADSWTGELKPLARIPFAALHVALGFDRIYALGVTLRAALDVESGELFKNAPAIKGDFFKVASILE